MSHTDLSVISSLSQEHHSSVKRESVVDLPRFGCSLSLPIAFDCPSRSAINPVYVTNAQTSRMESEGDIDIGALIANYDEAIFGDEASDGLCPARKGNGTMDEVDGDVAEKPKDKPDDRVNDKYGNLDSESDEEEIQKSVKRKKPVFIDDEAEEEDSQNKNKRVVDGDPDGEFDDIDDDLDGAGLDAADFIDDAEIEEDSRSSSGYSKKGKEPKKEKGSNKTTDLPSTQEENSKDNDVIDIGALKAKYDKIIFGEVAVEAGKEAERSNEYKVTTAGDEVEIKPIPKPIIQEKAFFQRPFIPSSTSVHLEQRFMLWNETGIVRAYSSETEDTIDVEFHDIAVHHSININNSSNYTLAGLSSEALVLASEKSEDQLSSKLFVMNFLTWDESNKEWSVDLPQDEFIQCLCVGSGFTAVITDANFVRIFTLAGIQVSLFSIPGSVVSCSAQENSLFVIYNSSPGIKNNPVLYCMISKINVKSSSFPKQPTPNPLPVSLTPDSLLVWCGFTDEGTPCIVDSKGHVRLLKSAAGNSWIPIVNLKENVKNKADNNWVIGVSEIQQSVRCIFCKGSRFPAVIPRPQVTMQSFEIPFTGRNTAKGKLEEKHFRSKLTNSLLEKLLTEGYDVEDKVQENYRNWNESLLRLFAMAVSSSCEGLALEIAHLMPSATTIESAVRYALNKRCNALAEKLREVASDKMNEPSEEPEEPEVDEYVESPRKSAVPANESEEVVLKPKGRNQLNQVEKGNEELLAPATKSRKRKPDESDGEENDCDQVNRKEWGFKSYFRNVRDQLEEENPDMDNEELRDVAREMFSGLSVHERKKYQEMSSKKCRMD